jgi:hypothetical protein
MKFRGGSQASFVVGAGRNEDDPHPEDIFFAQLVKTNPDAPRDALYDDLILYSRHTTSQKLVARVWVNEYADGTSLSGGFCHYSEHLLTWYPFFCRNLEQ